MRIFKNLQIVKNALRRINQSLFVEGGGRTISNFIDTDLYDELQIYYAPKLIGNGRSLYSGLKQLNDDIKLKVNKIEIFGNDVKITYHK